MTFFIARFRYKLAFLCVISVIIMLINCILVHISFHEMLKRFGITFAILLAIGIYLWYPAFSYYFSDPKEVWDSWECFSRRKRRSEFEDFHFDCVYKNTRFGLAKEAGKGYRTLTTLKSCTCAEYRKNHVPCVHMYKLADILGLFR